MTASVKIILDSITREGIRVTTFQLRYPRLIHSEFMTHRLFSRNASSSRAIPVERLIQDVIDDTAMPSKWGRNKPGMQAGEDWSAPIYVDYFDDHGNGDILNITEEFSPEEAWLFARDRAVEVARAFAKSEYHKQVVNRLLEPFSHINVVVTSTDYNNFFALRYHADADPTIKELAEAMYAAYSSSEPFVLMDGCWHLPYVTVNDKNKVALMYPLSLENITDNVFASTKYIETLIKISVARCARVSYKTHDGRETTVEEDVELFDRLLASVPLHASPAEHQVTPDRKVLVDLFKDDTFYEWQYPELHGNLRGVIQYRKTLPGEFQATFEPQDIL